MLSRWLGSDLFCLWGCLAALCHLVQKLLDLLGAIFIASSVVELLFINKLPQNTWL